MYRGLLTSFVGHALLLAYALFEIHAAPPDMPPVIPIEATIITPSELTRLKQGDPTKLQWVLLAHPLHEFAQLTANSGPAWPTARFPIFGNDSGQCKPVRRQTPRRPC